MDVSKFTIGRPVRIKTDDDIYDSYISAITLSDENFVYFKSGSLRITLLDKLKSDKNEVGNKLDVTGGTIKGDLTVNKQIYMGENKVLSYDINTNSLVDEEGNTYIQNKLIELFNGVASAGDTINLKEDYTKYNMLHVVTGTATGEYQGALLGSTISTLNQIDTFKNWLYYSETTGLNVQIHVASFTVIDSKTLTLLNAAFQNTARNNTANLQAPTACKVRKIYGSM